ncbi:MAG: hypothetical protein WBO93_09725, partial [Gammaproteobacteria bacterium]
SAMLLFPACSGVMHSENADELLIVQLFPFKSSVKGFAKSLNCLGHPGAGEARSTTITSYKLAQM